MLCVNVVIGKLIYNCCHINGCWLDLPAGKSSDTFLIKTPELLTVTSRSPELATETLHSLAASSGTVSFGLLKWSVTYLVFR